METSKARFHAVVPRHVFAPLVRAVAGTAAVVAVLSYSAPQSEDGGRRFGRTALILGASARRLTSSSSDATFGSVWLQSIVAAIALCVVALAVFVARHVVSHLAEGEADGKLDDVDCSAAERQRIVSKTAGVGGASAREDPVCKPQQQKAEAAEPAPSALEVLAMAAVYFAFAIGLVYLNNYILNNVFK
jgi:hypothetical protein